MAAYCFMVKLVKYVRVGCSNEPGKFQQKGAADYQHETNRQRRGSLAYGEVFRVNIQRMHQRITTTGPVATDGENSLQ